MSSKKTPAKKGGAKKVAPKKPAPKPKQEELDDNLDDLDEPVEIKKPVKQAKLVGAPDVPETKVNAVSLPPLDPQNTGDQEDDPDLFGEETPKNPPVQAALQVEPLEQSILNSLEDDEETAVAEPLKAPEETYEPIPITDRLTIYFRDTDADMVNAWDAAFHDQRMAQLAASQGYELKIVTGSGKVFDFEDGQVDAIVAPTNSFGHMNNGVDHECAHLFGAALENEVIDQVAKKHKGVLPVGRAMITYLTKYTKKFRILITTPVSMLPGVNVQDTLNPYLAFKGVLDIIQAYNSGPHVKKITSLVCPALAVEVGRVPPFRSALQIRVAIDGFFGKGFCSRNAKEQREHYNFLVGVKKPFNIVSLYKP